MAVRYIMKIGGMNSDRGYRLEDPAGFGPKLVSEEIQNGKSWKNLTQQISAPNARVWFGEYPSVTFREWLRQHEWDAEGVEKLISDFDFLGLDSHEVFPSFLRTPDTLGEAVLPLTDSPLAQKILDELGARGIDGQLISCLPAGGILIDLETPVAWIGAWGTIYGSRCFVRFEIRKDAYGTERAIFSTTLLVSTRENTQEITTEVQEAVVLGFWMQTLLYVAENPFPSSLMSFSRDLTLQEVPANARPMPVAWIEPFGLTLTQVGSASGGQVMIDTATYPAALNTGYVIEEGPHLSQSIAHAVDALVAAASVVEDGFRNMRNRDSVVAFDQVFASEFDLMDNPIGQVNGYARWVPEPLLGELTSLTTSNYRLVTEGQGDDRERRAALEWIANFGAGQFTASAINTLAFSFLIPEGSDDLAKFYLNHAIAMDVLDEATNAMANLGGLHIRMGRYEEAVAVLEQALDRPDRFAEGEASFLLGRLYAELGNMAAARSYLERAAASPDDAYAQQARQELSKLGLAGGSIKQNERARFCSGCGSQFHNDSENFCVNCGQRRS